MSPRARGPRWCAALTALWLVACGVLGLHHRAAVDHASGALGDQVHAPGLAGHHDADAAAPDIHAQRSAPDDHGPCLLAAAQDVGAPRAPRTSPAAVLGAARCDLCARASHRPAAHVLRDAPKTSPPTA